MTSFRTDAGDEPVEVDLLAATGDVTGATVTTDTIAEKTPGAGVTVDGMKIKDGAIPVTATAGQPLDRPVSITWETATGTVLTVPAGEVWFVRSARIFTVTTWNGTGADVDVGIVSVPSGTDTDGLIDGSANAGMLTANGNAGFVASEGGVKLWDTDHSMECVLFAGDTITVAVTPGTGASAGSSMLYVSGSRFVAPA